MALVERRVQFSSCDQCRRARVACDARRHGTRSCTRCRTRELSCTSEWIKSVKPSPLRANMRRSLRHTSLSPDARPLSDFERVTGRPARVERTHNGDSSIARNNLDSPRQQFAQPLTNTEAQWLHTVYEQAFETIFGTWMGCHGCPFVYQQREKSDIAVSISQLCRRMDAWINEDGDMDEETDRLIEGSLSGTIEAFAVRWLSQLSPAALASSPVDLIETIWRRTRRDMLRVINRPSYRSILTLLLFGLTPVPASVPAEEELDGISGPVCIQSALHIVQVLRARHHVLRFNGYKVSPILPRSSLSPKDDELGGSLLSTENMVYWAALTFDTSASLTFCSRPTLSAGLFGIESESSWRLVRACRKIFHDAAETWHSQEFEWTDLKANQLIAAASMWKLLVFKMAAIFKEALGDGHDELEVIKALSAAVQSLEEWNETFRPLLAACHTRIHFFNQETKLRWYELMLHYHLAILLLVDIVDVAQRSDLLPQLIPHRNEAETWILNCLDFGLNNTVTLSLQYRNDLDPPLSIDDTRATVPITAIDPYPHHVVAAVQFLRKAVRRDMAADRISPEVCESLLQRMAQTLRLLPNSSKSVQAASAEVFSPH